MKFEEIKKIAAWDILIQLQNKTRENVQLIKENSEIIQLVLKGEVQTESIGKVQASSNELLKENSEHLKLHNALLTYLKSLQNIESFTIPSEAVLSNELIPADIETIKLGFDDYLQSTIQGLMVFDSTHPYFCSEEFKSKLIHYYSEIEEYEKCAGIANSNCNKATML